MTDSKRRPAGPSSGSVARFKEQHLMQRHSRKKPSEKISPSPPGFPEQPAIEGTSPEGPAARILSTSAEWYVLEQTATKLTVAQESNFTEVYLLRALKTQPQQGSKNLSTAFIVHSAAWLMALSRMVNTSTQHRGLPEATELYFKAGAESQE
ncbi:hypothetical protein AOLI_G00223050 [Acnodon oligacanthus]